MDLCKDCGHPIKAHGPDGCRFCTNDIPEPERCGCRRYGVSPTDFLRTWFLLVLVIVPAVIALLFLVFTKAR